MRVQLLQVQFKCHEITFVVNWSYINKTDLAVT